MVDETSRKRAQGLVSNVYTIGYVKTEGEATDLVRKALAEELLKRSREAIQGHCQGLNYRDIQGILEVLKASPSLAGHTNNDPPKKGKSHRTKNKTLKNPRKCEGSNLE